MRSPRGPAARNPAVLEIHLEMLGMEMRLEVLSSECDLVICLHEPSSFRAVGESYEDFVQVTDDEVIALLDRASGK